jgi:plasmid stability protein
MQNAVMVNVTVRDVPDGVRDVLAQRAALRGQSLQQFIKQLLTDAAARPDEREVLASIRARIDADPIGLSTDEIVQAIHEGRR